MIESHITAKGISLLLKGLESLPAAVIEGGRRGMLQGLDVASGIAQQEFLSGPRPEKLGVVTRRLRDSLAFQVTANADGVTGALGSNVVYAAYHEFGFVGTVHVKAHARTVKQLENTGMAIENGVLKNAEGNPIARIIKGKKATNQIQQVKGHDRKINYKGRPFVRPALERALPFLMERIQAEIETEMKNLSSQFIYVTS